MVRFQSAIRGLGTFAGTARRCTFATMDALSSSSFAFASSVDKSRTLYAGSTFSLRGSTVNVTLALDLSPAAYYTTNPF